MDFNFTSQICTTKEQSERLLALGLKKVTADCVVSSIGSKDRLIHTEEPIYVMESLTSKRIPNYLAWSLNRLIEMMPNNIRVYDSIASLIVSNEKVQYYFHDVEYSDYLTSVGRWKSGDIYDNIIDCIEWLIKEGYFNKEYLEE